jgi:hypothetical protein
MVDRFRDFFDIWPVLAATFVYWGLGFLWYSVFFGPVWYIEMEKLDIQKMEKEALKKDANPDDDSFMKTEKPSSPEKIQVKIYLKMALSVILNFITVLAIDFFIINWAGSGTTPLFAIKIGIFLGFCFAVTNMLSVFMRENKGWVHLLIDCGYPLVAFVAACLVLTLWSRFVPF